MAEDRVKIGACDVIIALALMKLCCRRRNRTVWVREWVRNLQRYGAYHQLVQELRLGDHVTYKNFLRMDIATFDELLDLVRPHITYTNTNMRCAVPPGERLAVTLRFLATGNIFYKFIIMP